MLKGSGVNLDSQLNASSEAKSTDSRTLNAAGQEPTNSEAEFLRSEAKRILAEVEEARAERLAKTSAKAV